jgi:hypothetical protein
MGEILNLTDMFRSAIEEVFGPRLSEDDRLVWDLGHERDMVSTLMVGLWCSEAEKWLVVHPSVTFMDLLPGQEGESVQIVVDMVYETLASSRLVMALEDPA